ncbi:putative ribosome-binding factor A, chloroplastic [Auxenochlorella protothecoides]|uniref:Putative ribosome-binding factor A, chloroplastic n=1 Tax=Auxenochlorella protothecoides TaxID=3075 RepID=A0A087SPY7_AUXPR|nr:putative ribosome-binding factor A, chloroplastic [Auxenochlorella protothecoides]KFM27791.1 putative ribosome-binding factor A, chloroplastic [Auxenochlorella protothecoides]
MAPSLVQAHPRRIAKVAKQIEREVGSLLIHDMVLQKAICPERRRGIDASMSAVASVTEVQLTRDMQVARVFLSIFSDEEGKAIALQGLQGLEGYVRRMVAREMGLRLIPELRFQLDDTMERSDRVQALLERVRAMEAGDEEAPPITLS